MNNQNILISIHPKHVKNILSGEKIFEYRKTVPKEKISSIVIYSTSPTMKIVAVSKVTNIHSSTPNEIWNKTKDRSGIEKSFYDSYFTNRDTAYAIELSEVQTLDNQISLSELGGSIFPPQSFQYIDSTLFEKIKHLGNVKSWTRQRLFS